MFAKLERIGMFLLLLWFNDLIKNITEVMDVFLLIG